jgi:protein-S-isoprenylcysteine O-methyltransferase Ste14
MANAPRRGRRFADLSEQWRIATAEAFARRRVALGFLSGAVTLALAQPTARSIAAGMSIAIAGEALRVWAAGHLNKAREVTSSGPYRWLAHPLYAGSAIMGVGLAIACANVLVAVLIAVYLIVTLTAAIKSEEAFLRRAFGDRYDLYRQRDRLANGAAPGGARRFAVSQAIANREHRAIVGLLVVVLLLVLKATYNGAFWRAAGP